MTRQKTESLARLLTAGMIGGSLIAVFAFCARGCDWARAIQKATVQTRIARFVAESIADLKARDAR